MTIPYITISLPSTTHLSRYAERCGMSPVDEESSPLSRLYEVINQLQSITQKLTNHISSTARQSHQTNAPNHVSNPPIDNHNYSPCPCPVLLGALSARGRAPHPAHRAHPARQPQRLRPSRSRGLPQVTTLDLPPININPNHPLPAPFLR